MMSDIIVYLRYKAYQSKGLFNDSKRVVKSFYLYPYPFIWVYILIASYNYGIRKYFYGWLSISLAIVTFIFCDYLRGEHRGWRRKEAYKKATATR